MQKRIIEQELIDFYEYYNIRNPIGIMFKIFITFGLYIIYWIYVTNYEFQEIDKNAPDAKKAIILILLIPLIWHIITLIISNILLPEVPLIADTIRIIGWSGFTFLSLEYIYEFCKSYSRVTKSSALLWYLSIYPGYYSIILTLFGFYYTLPLIFFPIICIPAMQSYLNHRYEQVNMKRISENFNSMYQGGHKE